MHDSHLFVPGRGSPGSYDEEIGHLGNDASACKGRMRLKFHELAMTENRIYSVKLFQGRKSNMQLRPGDQAPYVVLEDISGQETLLEDQWRSGQHTLLVFLRHLG